MTIIGTRPQFVKSAMVSKSLKESEIEEVLVHTGQHFDDNMSSAFFKELNIDQPAINLGINRLHPATMIGRMTEMVSNQITKTEPDSVIVYGDCNTTLSGALAAKYSHVPLIHIEAGLRSYRRDMAEENNRVIVDRISDFLFCPTKIAFDNLHSEGLQELGANISWSGDVMYDAALHYSHLADNQSNIFTKYPDLTPGEYFLCTFHREENTLNSGNLIQIVDAINILAASYQVVIPLHPRTRKAIELNGLKLKATVIPPLGYFDMNLLVRNAKIILTDSGGLQKEAYFFNKYSLILRRETEWKELEMHGFSFLVGTEAPRIIEGVQATINQPFKEKIAFFGDGQASKKIVNHLVSNIEFFQSSL